MALVDLIGAVSASGVLGGITGLIGNELKSRRELKMMKLQGEMEQAAWPEREKVREHEMAMRSGSYGHEIELHGLNAKAKSEEDERKIIMQETEFSGKGLVASLKNDAPVPGEPMWVAAVRTLTRPVLITALVLMLGLVFFNTPDAQRGPIIKAIIYMTCVGVLYYFGDRPSSAMRKMLMGGPS